MKLLPYGDAALLVEVGDLEGVLDLYRQLRGRDDLGIVELVPAAHTLLVQVDTARTTVARIARDIGSLQPRAEVRAVEAPIEVPVSYDGDDLAEVAQLTGLGVDGVIEAHTAQVWTVGFVGFAPGFSYLVGQDARLQVPRRAEPRSAVPTGAVGLADRFSGVYPRRSPGGWQLIGRTDVVMWDIERDPPALLRPGSTVRFVVAG